MADEAVRAYVEGHRQAFVDRLATAVAQPSISARNLGVREMAQLLLGWLAEAGFEARTYETPGQPVIVAQAGPARGTAPRVLIYGHYDVQPPEPLDLWHSPPFEPTIRDGKMYGRGTGDNKGQHLAHILGVQAWCAVRGDLPIGVTLVLEGEEESSSPHLDAFVRDHRDLLACDLAVTSDGPMAPGDVPVITLGVRGILSFELRTEGARFDNHSGNKGNAVPDPTWRLIEVLSALRGPDGRVRLPGFYDKVRPVGDVERRCLEALPFDPPSVAHTLGLDEAVVAGWDPIAFHRRLTLEPTFSVNSIGSGQIEQKKTIIPAFARARCDMRMAADQDPEEIQDALQGFLAERFPDVRYIPHGFMHPSRTRLDHPAVDAVRRALRDVHGVEPLVQPALGGSLPDYVWTRTLGVPSLIVPYANSDEANHAPDENMRIDLFLRGIEATAAMLGELSAALPAAG